MLAKGMDEAMRLLSRFDGNDDSQDEGLYSTVFCPGATESPLSHRKYVVLRPPFYAGLA